ncbi:RNA polymerase Rpb3/Rpb11 dimerization domain-containing protein [Pavlovales sp. CCMP2436]|nr:RNA polymerase Rpb3/Rpb11 dimerization domain-containing protein [Pavlovales sp. CCMP2436]|mmetsp:Transcript_33421/g.77104  ORF Transcript_33421/g.77104 Transcript_33421/m.77104 type:complete len:122 (-) Transcript_33421:162-527(-)
MAEQEPVENELGAPPRTLGIEVQGAEVSRATFTLTHEDHTLGNAVRYLLAKNPQVSFVGYSVPHPSEPKMNIRVQTTGVQASDVLLDSLLTLYKVADHIDNTFVDALATFKFKAQGPPNKR